MLSSFFELLLRNSGNSGSASCSYSRCMKPSNISCRSGFSSNTDMNSLCRLCWDICGVPLHTLELNDTKTPTNSFRILTPINYLYPFRCSLLTDIEEYIIFFILNLNTYLGRINIIPSFVLCRIFCFVSKLLHGIKRSRLRNARVCGYPMFRTSKLYTDTDLKLKFMLKF